MFGPLRDVRLTSFGVLIISTHSSVLLLFIMKDVPVFFLYHFITCCGLVEATGLIIATKVLMAFSSEWLCSKNVVLYVCMYVYTCVCVSLKCYSIWFGY